MEILFLPTILVMPSISPTQHHLLMSNAPSPTHYPMSMPCSTNLTNSSPRSATSNRPPCSNSSSVRRDCRGSGERIRTTGRPRWEGFQRIGGVNRLAIACQRVLTMASTHQPFRILIVSLSISVSLTSLGMGDFRLRNWYYFASVGM